MHLLRENPVKDIDAPKLKKSLPKYLTLDESLQLLQSVDGKHQERDYCILTLFLNCGLRISELVGLNLSDIQGEALRVLGKGNKARILYLNDACQAALQSYLAVRRPIQGRDQDALFLSARNERISRPRPGPKAHRPTFLPPGSTAPNTPPISSATPPPR